MKKGNEGRGKKEDGWKEEGLSVGEISYVEPRRRKESSLLEAVPGERPHLCRSCFR